MSDVVEDSTRLEVGSLGPHPNPLRKLTQNLGLSVHMTQVHKETLTTIENALPNRSNLDVEIFGMEGIPDDVVGSHNQRVLSQFAQAEAERRAATGNSGPGGAGSGAAKKPKLETPSDLKKRLAEHKAKKAAEQATGGNSGDVTPVQGGTQGSPGPAFAQMAGFVRCIALSYLYSWLIITAGCLAHLYTTTNFLCWYSQQLYVFCIPSALWPVKYAISAAASNFPATVFGIRSSP